MGSNLYKKTKERCLYMLAMAVVLLSTGCQVDVAGQTLPSPWYHHDDIQYFAHGPEFLLAREAAAMEQYKAERVLDEDQGP